MTRDENETLYDGEEHIKILEPVFEDMTKKLIKGFELMANQLRGKMAAGGSRNFHHGETHNTIHFEYFYDGLN